MIDILFDTNGRLIGQGQSTKAHQQDLLIMHKGWHKFAPHIGVALSDYAHDEGTEALLIAIQSEFTNDGMNVKTLGMDANNNLVIDANY